MQIYEKISIYCKWLNLRNYGANYALMKIFGRVPVLRAIYRNFYRGLQKQVNSNWCGDSLIQMTDDCDRLICNIEKFGFSKGLNLRQTAVDAINKYAFSAPTYAYLDKGSGFLMHERTVAEAKLQKKILLSHYCNVYKDCSVIKSISDSKGLSTIARKYLGGDAKRIATQLWWTFPVEVDAQTRSRAAHFFHRDLDGWAFLKFFFYITPVLANEGAHVFAEGSHRPSFLQILKERFRINRHSDFIVSKWYPSIIETIGPAGMGLVEDTFGLHKGLTPKGEPRLILCIVFGHNTYKGIQEFTAAPHELRNI
jgi:hypothetical protein